MAGSCHVCNQIFSITDIEHHVKSDHGPNGQICLVLIKVKHDQELPKSEQKVKSETLYKCDKCTHMAMSLRSMELHNKKVHGSLHNCDKCDKKF